MAADNIEYDKPNLQKKSVVFETVMGVGWGAASAAILTPVINGAFNLVRRGRYEKIPLTESMLGNMIFVGAFNGLLNAGETLIGNHHKDTVRPYVEKLEQENATKDALLRNTPNRS